MFDVVIIGSGPAGISASLYALRAGLGCLVIGKDKGALKKADSIENYYGFVEPISGKKLVQNGILQARRLGAKIKKEEVVGIAFEDCFKVQTVSKEYSAKAVIIATGASRNAPKIEGLTALEGKGVSYCAVCDAFFFRNKTVAVLGNSNYALHELTELRRVAKNTFVLTNGMDITADFGDAEIISAPIQRLLGENKLESVEFNDGKKLDIDGLFVALGTAGSVELARKIGAATEKNRILVDKDMRTNIPLLFAAGDCTGGLLQISKAVSDGAIAGLSAIKDTKS